MTAPARRSLAAMAVCLLAASAAACSPKSTAPPPPPPPAPLVADQTLWVGLSRTDAQALRAAMMRGQLEVALRLVGEGAGAAASAHILRIDAELYAPAKADYARARLSLDEAAFKGASDAAAAGASRRDMEHRADDLRRQIDRLAPREGYWSKAGAVTRVLQELAHQYAAGVQGGFVVNEERYEDALGLAIVAREIIKDAVDDGKGKDQSRVPELEREAEGLVNMFPSARAPSSPASAGEVLAQISRVELAFPAIE